MQIVSITALCVASAMICAALRPQRPEMATAVSLAMGAAIVAMICARFSATGAWAQIVGGWLDGGGEHVGPVLRACGIAIVSELGVQVCRDAGESAMAGRILLAQRLAVLCLCAPMLGGMLRWVDGLAL